MSEVESHDSFESDAIQNELDDPITFDRKKGPQLNRSGLSNQELLRRGSSGRKLGEDVKKSYNSRRNRVYDDDQSVDEDGGSEFLATTNEDKQNTYLNTKGEVIVNKPNPRFKNYRELFNNLIKTTDVVTMYPIVSVIISYDSTHAITVTKRNPQEYYVKMYDLETYEMTFEEKIGGHEDDYIKCKEVEQNTNGSKFAIAYSNDGCFFMRHFGK